MKTVILAAALVCLSGCHKVGEQVQLHRAKSDIASAMKDPGSAEFRNVTHAKYGNSRVVCGEVNGRNGFGAMGGFRSFMYVQPLMRFESEAGGSAVSTCCDALKRAGMVAGVQSTADIPQCSGVEPAMPI